MYNATTVFDLYWKILAPNTSFELNLHQTLLIVIQNGAFINNGRHFLSDNLKICYFLISN